MQSSVGAAAYDSVRIILPYRQRRNPLRDCSMAEKGGVTKGLVGATVTPMIRRYEDKIAVSNVRFEFLFSAGVGKSPEIHIITLPCYLLRYGNY